MGTGHRQPPSCRQQVATLHSCAGSERGAGIGVGAVFNCGRREWIQDLARGPPDESREQGTAEDQVSSLAVGKRAHSSGGSGCAAGGTPT